MKGIVFNLLEEVITQHYGADQWDSLLDATGLSGVYTSLGSYPDADMMALVEAASQELKLSPPAVIRWFGQESMGNLARRYPQFFENHSTTRSFLRSLNSIIHPEVKKIYAGAIPPIFDYQDSDDGALLMGYHSARKLCALAQGFSEGAASFYDEQIEFKHLNCMHNGDPKCTFHIKFYKS